MKKMPMVEIWNYEKISAPFIEGDYTYFYKNDGLQDQSVVYRKKNGEDAEEVDLDDVKDAPFILFLLDDFFTLFSCISALFLFFNI